MEGERGVARALGLEEKEILQKLKTKVVEGTGRGEMGTKKGRLT